VLQRKSKNKNVRQSIVTIEDNPYKSYGYLAFWQRFNIGTRPILKRCQNARY